MQKYSLKELRARKNLTQVELSRILGISVPTYNSWERDVAKVAIGKVKVIAEFYGITIDEIFLPNYMKNIHIQ